MSDASELGGRRRVSSFECRGQSGSRAQKLMWFGSQDATRLAGLGRGLSRELCGDGEGSE